MADVWQLLVQSNTVNFLIVFMAVLFLVSKLNIKNKIENIRNEIKSYVEDSEQEKENAKRELERINEKIKHLPEETADIQSSAQRNIKGIEQKIETEIKDKMQDIENNAKRILNLEDKKFKSKLSGILSQAGVKLAKENAIEQLKNNRELHNKYINDAIDEIDGINL